MLEPAVGNLLQLNSFVNNEKNILKKSNGNEVPFKEILLKAFNEVNALQKEAEQKASEVALGKASSVHEAIIASEKATLALQLFTQFQNKLIDAYHEIMRMQL